MADADPKLRREVVVPAPRSSGAAVVLISAMAMFTAVGASAFVVRARTKAKCCEHSYSSDRPARPAPRLASVPNMVERESFVDERVRGFREARATGHLEQALLI